MSEQIKHECGIALVRLKKPLSFYKEKYGSTRYGLNKLYLLMEKMRNRGQDGAGVVAIKLDVEPGERYISRERSKSSNATQEIFERINSKFVEAKRHNAKEYDDAAWQKKNIPFTGEVLMGHLRYGTFGKNSIENCHPFLRQNNWMTRNLVVAGNFNLTNVEELFDELVALGQHPKEKADTVTVMEKIGHFLDKENDRLFKIFKENGLDNKTISQEIAKDLNVAKVLKEASKKWDGGYVIGGIMGHGDAFVLRDPNGIRPAYWFENDEFVVVASERPVIQTVFNIKIEAIKEVKPGHAIIVKKNGQTSEVSINESSNITKCSFERIYFSRGNDADIYQERKRLGKALLPKILEAVHYEFEDSVFAYIPNTAELAFSGLCDGLHEYADKLKLDALKQLKNKDDESALNNILSIHPRIDKIVLKDAKQRTFITDDEHRNDLVNMVYDTTYGLVKPGVDNLVVLDDSIVRGTTLKQSILRILDRLQPKRIVVVSSCPQIRYPDCYGIDMSVLGRFVAFDAVIHLIKERNMEDLMDEVYEMAKIQEALPSDMQQNVVKKLYEPFSIHEISGKIADLIKPADLNAELVIIYQTIEGLHKACPDHKGDWYFTGNYPTPGGNKVANKAFIHYMEGKTVRAY
jgi:amidophosphoribosyltransferase